MDFFLLINVKMPTIVGILTFLSMKNSILGLSEPNISQISSFFYTYEHLKFHAQLTSGLVLSSVKGRNHFRKILGSMLLEYQGAGKQLYYF